MSSTLTRRRGITGTPEQHPPAVRRGGDIAEWRWFLTVVGATLALALSTSGGLAGGDGPETTAGVASLGILHAPGYVVYVLAARLFSLVVPFGDLAQQVSWFSTLCAAGSATGVFRLARRAGARPSAAALGSGVLATTASFWFNASYAKHGTFTALLVVGALVLASSSPTQHRWTRPLGTGILVGTAAGAGWYAMAVAVPALVWLLVADEQTWRGRGRVLAVASVATVLTVASVIGWTVVRSAANPRDGLGGRDDTSADRRPVHHVGLRLRSR